MGVAVLQEVSEGLERDDTQKDKIKFLIVLILFKDVCISSIPGLFSCTFRKVYCYLKQHNQVFLVESVAKIIVDTETELPVECKRIWSKPG